MNVKMAIEIAAEFGERFPDEYDSEVFDHVAFVMQKEITSNMVIARVIIAAYESGIEAGQECAKAYGI